MKRIELAVGEELEIKLEGTEYIIEGSVSEISIRDADKPFDAISLELVVRIRSVALPAKEQLAERQSKRTQE